MLFIRTIKAEKIKLKRSLVWIAFILLPIIPAIMGTFNYLQNIDILTDGWYSLWTQHTLFSCYFFLPVIIGVYCSYLYRLEHVNHNWYRIMTLPIPPIYSYLSKLIVATCMVLLTQIWIGVLFVVSGKLCGLTGSVPIELIEWLLYGVSGGSVICAIQLSISLVIRSFAVPVGMALIGGIGSIAAIAAGYGVMYPYSLLGLGMRANAPGGPIQCSIAVYFQNSILYILICVLFAYVWMKKRDVVVG